MSTTPTHGQTECAMKDLCLNARVVLWVINDFTYCFVFYVASKLANSYGP